MTAEVVISPAMTHRPVVNSVSHATRACLSWVRIASSTASDTWSAILSGCPSDTDSDVKMKSFCMTAPVVPVTDCVTGSGDRQSGDALAVFVSRPQVVKINAAALAHALCTALSFSVNSPRGTPIHNGLLHPLGWKP